MAKLNSSRLTCLQDANFWTKVNYIVHSALAGRVQHLLVHCEGIYAYKSLLYGRCAARACCEQQSPSAV